MKGNERRKAYTAECALGGLLAYSLVEEAHAGKSQRRGQRLPPQEGWLSAGTWELGWESFLPDVKLSLDKSGLLCLDCVCK